MKADRGAYRLIARREFVERVRDKSFIVSTALTLVILLGVIVAGAALGGPASFDLGVVGPGSREPASLVAGAGRARGITVRLHELEEEEAEPSLRSGDSDAVLVDGERVLVRSQPPAQLVQLLQGVAQLGRVRLALEGAGMDDPEVDRLLDPQPLPVIALEPPQPHQQENASVAFVAVLVLYGQLFGYGVWVATGVVEEKSSRVVELLLSAVRPTQLLRGKILGLGALGLGQLLMIGAVVLPVALAAGVVAVPSSAMVTLLLVLFWFLVGFAFYSSLFAVAGALVSRQEELQNGLLPLQMLVLVSFVLSLEALQDPSSVLARVASLVPFSSPLAMPTRLAQGEAGLAEALSSLALSAGAIAVVIPLAARLYSGAILRVGARVRIRDAWRADQSRR